MFVGKASIDGQDLMNMIFSGAQILHSQVKTINNLNVFPVPDGDTGTNMSLTINAGMDMLNRQPSADISQVADVFAKGLLMGARGNSGVIMSQLFRGFAKSVSGLSEVDGAQFAAALQSGVEMAYEAVVKPVEGTILTVSREAAQYGALLARDKCDVLTIMQGVLKQAKETLAKTPDLLPVLKQAGVVDSGGQGLVCLYEGFCTVLEQGNVQRLELSPIDINENNLNETYIEIDSAQAHFDAEDIIYPYDMEFLIYLDEKKSKKSPFNVESFRKRLTKNGDSVLVIVDEQVVKVHVHTSQPGEVLDLALRYGELSQFHIENMRDQHRAIVGGPLTTEFSFNNHVETDDESAEVETNTELAEYGVVAVSIGEGLSDVFESLGVDRVLFGGQTMNPSTENIVTAIREIRAQKIFVLPNNPNIIMAAKLAQEFTEQEVIVIPTTSIPQGIAAMLALREDIGPDANVKAMEQAIKNVKTGQITRAVRESKYNEIIINKGHYIGMYDGEIVVADDDIVAVGRDLLERMITDTDEILTLFMGKEAALEQSNAIVSYIKENYEDLEVETLHGGQPLYDYIFSVE